MPPSPSVATTGRRTRRRATAPLPSAMVGYADPVDQTPIYRAVSPSSLHPVYGGTFLRNDTIRHAEEQPPWSSESALSAAYHYRERSSGVESPDRSPDLAAPPSQTQRGAESSRRPPGRFSLPQSVPSNDSCGVWTGPSGSSSQSLSGAVSAMTETDPPTPTMSLSDANPQIALVVTSSEEVASEDSPMTPPESSAPPLASDLSKYRKGYKLGPPRPPNAWILYRSEKLKAIAAGERFENLEAILAEQRTDGEEPSTEGARAPRRGSTQKPKIQPKATANGKKKKQTMDTDTEQEEQDDDDADSKAPSTSKTVPQAEISKVISLMWKREKKEEKARFEKMAHAKKLEHALMYPDYKFKPMKREDKQRLKEEIQEERTRIKQEKATERLESRKKATKVKPTVALIEEEEKPPARSLEPSSGPVEKKSRKNARSKKTSPSMATIAMPNPGEYRERLASPGEYRRFAQGAPEGPSLGLSAAYLHPIDPTVPQEFRRGGFHDDMHLPPYGAHMNALVGTRQEESSSQSSTFRRPGQPVINYFPAVNSEVFQGLPGHHSHPGPPSMYASPYYHPPPVSYAAPAMYPGFAVGGEDVVPYIFEPMPFRMVAPVFDPMPPADTTSSKEVPAIGTMGSMEYQPMGVSEAELVEMWALLQDDDGDQNDVQRGTDERTMLLGDAWATSPEVALSAWSEFGQPIQEPEERIPITQLSGPVASHIISNDWQEYEQPHASVSAFPNPLTPQTQPKVSGYTAPAYSPSNPKGPGRNAPKHLEIHIPKAGPSSLPIGMDTIYQGPYLSSQTALSPMVGSLEEGPVDHRSNNSERSRQAPDRDPRRLPTPPSRNASYSNDFHLPTPQPAAFFGSQQLTPQTYCDPILSFPGSEHSSISGGTPFGWNSEDDRGADAFRVPSFADAGRVFSGFSGTGTTPDKEGAYGTSYQYRNFSLDTIGGPISRSASSATATSAERENRDER